MLSSKDHVTMTDCIWRTDVWRYKVDAGVDGPCDDDWEMQGMLGTHGSSVVATNMRRDCQVPR